MQKLKEKLNQYYQNDKENRPSEISEKGKQEIISSSAYQNRPEELQQAKINNFVNYSSTNATSQQEKAKVRSISVDPGQKYYTPFGHHHTQ